MKIRPPSAGDRAAWDALYSAYADFQNVAIAQHTLDGVWAQLLDPESPLLGLIADRGDDIPGLVHFQPFFRPLQGCWNGFVNDLFVSPDARGEGLAESLMAAVESHARDAGWTEVRWATGSDNARAIAFYERMANRTGLITFKLPVSG